MSVSDTIIILIPTNMSKLLLGVVLLSCVLTFKVSIDELKKQGFKIMESKFGDLAMEKVDDHKT